MRPLVRWVIVSRPRDFTAAITPRMPSIVIAFSGMQSLSLHPLIGLTLAPIASDEQISPLGNTRQTLRMPLRHDLTIGKKGDTSQFARELIATLRRGPLESGPTLALVYGALPHKP